MHDFPHIELSDLFDMLSMHTSQYMKMLSDGATKVEFNECRETITNIQREILLRQKHTADAAAVAVKDLSFTIDHSPSGPPEKIN